MPLRPAARLGLLLLALLTSLAWLRLQAHPAAPAVDARVRGGALVAAGGGALPDEVYDRFFELSGGPNARIVVIPGHRTGPNSEGRLLAPWKARRPASLALFQLDFRGEASDPAKLAPLDEATGVWFGGGSQTWIAGLYARTPVEERLLDVLDRGGAVGGTSAGASVLSRVMIAGGRDRAFEGRGLSLFPGAAIDQHFLRRNRIGRLRSLLESHPDLIGFGVDEGTALVLRRQTGELSVVGRSYVVSVVPAAGGHPERLEILKTGDTARLDHLREPSIPVVQALDPDLFGP